MLSLEGVSLRLGDEEEAPRLLSHLNCSFRRGEFVAVIGPSGCGKSTFLMTYQKWLSLKYGSSNTFNFLRGYNSGDRWAMIDGEAHRVITLV